MIHTRKTIFKTLQKKIRELTKHANYDSKEFKKILIAVILNDMKEWSEYIPKDDPDKITDMLAEYLLNNCFLIERITNHSEYTNVNTPQTNNTWQRIWDRESSQLITDLSKESHKDDYRPWIIDPSCEIKIVYFLSVDSSGQPISNIEYLKNTYGKYGAELKTVCEKMSIFMDRTTGKAWYLTENCEWKPVGGEDQDGMTQEEVEQLILQHRVQRTWKDEQDGSRKIELTLVNDPEAPNALEVLTANDVEDLV